MDERYRAFGHDSLFFVVDMESGLVVIEPTDRDTAERMAAELSLKETADN
jgi:hypothetical protein